MQNKAKQYLLWPICLSNGCDQIYTNLLNSFIQKADSKKRCKSKQITVAYWSHWNHELRLIHQ